MSRSASLFVSLTLFLLATALQAAPAVVPPPPKLDARSYILIDYDSGEVLAEKNADERIEPASITKMMTAYLVDQELRRGNIGLDDEVPISEKAWRMKGSRMFVEVGKKVPLRELLKGMIIQSGNDATVALAEYIAGTEEAFVDMMNAQAQALGMTGTHFTNSTGWPDPEHYSTARDLAILARALIRDFPERYALYKEKKYTWNGITQYNRNRLLWRDKSVDGVKTGHTESAGYCLVSSAQRDGMRLIAVVLGTKSDKARTQQSQALLNYGFRFFETHKLYGAGQKLAEVRVWFGARDKVGVGPAEDIFVTVPRGRYGDLKAGMDLQPSVEAPVEKGRELGRLRVTLDGKPKREAALHALAAVPEGGLWEKVRDTVLRWFE